MKKFIALTIIASAMGGTLALADEAQQGVNDKSSPAAQQLADNQDKGATVAAPKQDEAKAHVSANGTKKHHHHVKKQAQNKSADNVVTADATPAASPAPVSPDDTQLTS